MTTAQQYFLTVVQQQSVARAAEQLYLSQQNLSNHIKRLEQQYGLLFVRKPKFELTLAGEALCKTLQQIRVLEQGLDARIQEIQSKQYGVLRFGIHPARARMILPRTLALYREIYPNVQIKLFFQDTYHDEKMLRDGALDLFLGVDTLPDPDFTYIHLQDEPIYFVASEQLIRDAGVILNREAIPLSVLPRFSYLLSPMVSHFRQKIDRFMEEAGVEITEKMSVGDFEVQLMLAAQKEGACFCAKMLLPKMDQLNRDLEAGDKLCSFPIEQLDVTSDISIVIHRLAYRSKMLNGFIESIERTIGR